MNLKILSLLAVSSIVTLILNNSVTYLFCEFVLLFLIVNRLKNISIDRNLIMFNYSIVFVYLVVSLYYSTFNPSTFLKVFNFSFIFLIVKKGDTLTLIKSIKPFIIPAFLYSLLVYLKFIPDFLNSVYDSMYVFGNNANSSIFFEANYAGLVLAIYSINSSNMFFKGYGLTVNIFADYLFGVLGIISSSLKALLSYNLIKILGLLIIIIVPWVLFNLGPLFFEQRFFIWSSYLDNIDLFRTYHSIEVQNKIYTGMSKSPWGLSGLNLHSGLFESISFKGFYYTLITVLLILMSYFKSNYNFSFLILFFVGTFQMFSLSLGGISYPSLIFSFIICESFVYGK